MTENHYLELMEGLQNLTPNQAVRLIWELSLNEPEQAHSLLCPNSLRKGVLDSYWDGDTRPSIGNKIKAIKWYRAQTGEGLKESKNQVEKILDDQRIDH